MGLQYKPDWEQTKEMLEAFWARENGRRCLLHVTARDEQRISNPIWPSRDEDGDLHDFWLNPANIIDRHLRYFEHTYFGAEALPWLDVRLGPGITAGYLGSPVHLATRTVWFEPVVDDWDGFSLSFEEDNYWWRKTLEITKEACRAGQGKFLTGITDLSGLMDIIAHLRGGEKLCLDLIDCPEQIKKARDTIAGIWFHSYDRLCMEIEGAREGFLDWLGLWAPSRYKTLQCDFCAMISPRMFEEFVLPELHEQCHRSPYTMFHLDGPAAVRHLDLLLDLPELNGIQWQPGAGQPMAVGWLPMLKKVQDAGKNLHIEAKVRDVPAILAVLSQEGLYIKVVEQFINRAEADGFIKEVETRY